MEDFVVLNNNEIQDNLESFDKDNILDEVKDEKNDIDNNMNDDCNKSMDKVDQMNNKIDEDDDSRKLFVGGLSWETTEEDLKLYFETWGKVAHCVIKLDKMTGNSRGFGFVTMETEECLKKVLEVPEHRLKNKKIDPKPAKPTKEPNKKIFVGGLSPEITEDQIKEYFAQYGHVESVDLPFDTSKGKRKPYVFLSFTTEDAAKNAIVNEKQDVLGSKCDVRMAVPKDQVNKNKIATWGPFSNSMYPPGSEYYSYEYPYGAPYSYDPNAYYSGYYSGYPYAYPMPPQPYVAPPRAPVAGGKVSARGRGNAAYHPYTRQQ